MGPNFWIWSNPPPFFYLKFKMKYPQKMPHNFWSALEPPLLPRQRQQVKDHFNMLSFYMALLQTLKWPPSLLCTGHQYKRFPPKKCSFNLGFFHILSCHIMEENQNKATFFGGGTSLTLHTFCADSPWNILVQRRDGGHLSVCSKAM